MLIRTFIISLLVINCAFAQEFTVRFGMNSTIYSFKSDGGNLNAKGVDISVKKQKCNQDLYLKFKGNVEHMLETMPIHKEKNIPFEKVMVKTEKKLSVFDRSSPEGRYFLGLADQFKNLKIKSNLKCKK